MMMRRRFKCLTLHRLRLQFSLFKFQNSRQFSCVQFVNLCLEKDMDDVTASDIGLLETTNSEDDAVDVSSEKSCGAHYLCRKGESESLSDIDDAEVDSYINNEKEKHYKKIIWEMMNQKYLQEREAKRVAAAAKDLKHKRSTGKKKAQSTAKTAHPATPKKRSSSKINYDVLSAILDEPLPSDNPKKRRSESDSVDVGKQLTGDEVNVDAAGVADESEDEEDGWQENPNYSYYNSQEEEHYDYDEDDEF